EAMRHRLARVAAIEVRVDEAPDPAADGVVLVVVDLVAQLGPPEAGVAEGIFPYLLAGELGDALERGVLDMHARVGVQRVVQLAAGAVQIPRVVVVVEDRGAVVLPYDRSAVDDDVVREVDP